MSNPLVYDRARFEPPARRYSEVRVRSVLAPTPPTHVRVSPAGEFNKDLRVAIDVNACLEWDKQFGGVVRNVRLELATDGSGQFALIAITPEQAQEYKTRRGDGVGLYTLSRRHTLRRGSVTLSFTRLGINTPNTPKASEAPCTLTKGILIVQLPEFK